MAPGLLSRLYTASPRDVVQAVRSKVGKGKARGHDPYAAGDAPPSRDFLLSEEYRELMSKHLPFDDSHDRHEAQNRTENFRFRHHVAAGRLGAFRWRGMQEHLATLLTLTEGAEQGRRLVLDLGGAAGPLGLGSKVVDRQAHDKYGDPVPYHDLKDVPESADVIFSSHTLEHIPDLDGILRDIHDTLRPGGHTVLHLPAFSCERWRAGGHTHAVYHDHVHTFRLSEPELPDTFDDAIAIDDKVAEHLDIVEASYCGDDSIWLVAQRPE